jgi:hypothetical protein
VGLGVIHIFERAVLDTLPALSSAMAALRSASAQPKLDKIAKSIRAAERSVIRFIKISNIQYTWARDNNSTIIAREHGAGLVHCNLNILLSQYCDSSEKNLRYSVLGTPRITPAYYLEPVPAANYSWENLPR